MKFIFKFMLITIFILFSGPENLSANPASQKQVLYLSGTDNQNTKTWDFFCTGGRKSGFWTTIEVPSHWEQQGFGIYNYGRDYHTYGRDYKYADEKGHYKHEFTVPEDWRDKEIILIFEGSMTDTEVKINGKVAGDIHQGSFYRFSYNVTDKIHFGATNRLQVTVSKMSANPSVNHAERYADYWIFGGIFRPVYLEAYPREYIARTAIAASADGAFSIDVFPQNITKKKSLTAEILDAQNNIVHTIAAISIGDNSKVTLKAQVDDALLWNSETPNLYKVNIYLKQGEKIVYQTTEKFGFRTVQVKAGDGIYINGRKIKMKGINRHVFWPETGRSVNRDIDLLDVQLIKEMNMNSVRCSHYPPDKSFLEICDSLGLYVLDELAGWQNAYDTEVGEKLVREMVIRDVNHPSVIFWSNGNEGGTNKELDDDFDLYDPSKRPVLHCHHKPGNAFNFIDTNHYESYQSTQRILQDSLIYMTTEFLHCQNDGGGAAGLQDYWDLMWASPKSAGGYLWALIDEGVVRTDLNGFIDVNGVNAPDGVLGPHREKEGSFFAIKEIFSPVYINTKEITASFNGELPVENRFDFTNISQIDFHWQLVRFRSPANTQPGHIILNKDVVKGSDIKPGQSGSVMFDLPGDWQNADALVLKAFDPGHNEIRTWSWKIKKNEVLIQDLLKDKQTNAVEVEESDSLLTLKTGKLKVAFNTTNGLLQNISRERSPFANFNNGPVICSGEAQFREIRHFSEEDGHVVQVNYSGDLQQARWKLYNNGWLELNYHYKLKGTYSLAGISFDFPEKHMLSVKWLGKGPYRVWKNRMQGVNYDVWQKGYNNTVTGTFPWVYPEFKGYHADVSWMLFDTVEGKFLVASKEDDLFVRLFEFYALPAPTEHPDLPPGDISFLDRIPAIGSKMSTKINAQPKTFGPMSMPHVLDEQFNRTLYFYFGDLQMPE